MFTWCPRHCSLSLSLCLSLLSLSLSLSLSLFLSLSLSLSLKSLSLSLSLYLSFSLSIFLKVAVIFVSASLDGRYPRSFTKCAKMCNHQDTQLCAISEFVTSPLNIWINYYCCFVGNRTTIVEKCQIFPAYISFKPTAPKTSFKFSLFSLRKLHCMTLLKMVTINAAKFYSKQAHQLISRITWVYLSVMWKLEKYCWPLGIHFNFQLLEFTAIPAFVFEGDFTAAVSRGPAPGRSCSWRGPAFDRSYSCTVRMYS